MACGCGAFDNFCSELQANAPLFPGRGGAGVNIDWCISVRYCKSNESESRALFSLKYHRAFERFFAVLACWRDNSPSQAKVHKGNQKIKEANVRTTEVSKKIHITKWNIRQLSDCKINTR